MSGNAPAVGSLVKGAACQCLDALSQDKSVMLNLHGTLQGMVNTNFVGLETVLGQHLLPLKFNPGQVVNLVQHLKDHWFDPNSASTFFPNVQVAKIYGLGLIRTLGKSLKANPPLPIDSNWLVDHNNFQMITFLYPGVGTSSRVGEPPDRHTATGWVHSCHQPYTKRCRLEHA